MPERSLSEVLSEIQGNDKLMAVQAAGHARRRQELLKEVQRLVAAGEKPDDPIATYAMLFASSQGPERQAAVEAQLRKINAGLKAHSGEPVLLVKHDRTLVHEGGCFGGDMHSDRPDLHLGVLDKGGLVFDFTDSCNIALSTTKYVSGDSKSGQVETGPMPVPAEFLVGVLGLGRADTDLAAGYEQVMSCNYRLILEGGADKLEKLAQRLGIGLLETEDA
jgi:hypothetical protein